MPRLIIRPSSVRKAKLRVTNPAEVSAVPRLRLHPGDEPAETLQLRPLEQVEEVGAEAALELLESQQLVWEFGAEQLY